MRRLGTITWALVLLLCLFIIGLRFQNTLPIETDFLSLLPDEEQSEWVRQANSLMKEEVTQRVVILVKAKEFETAKSFANEIVKQLAPYADLNKQQDQIQDFGKTLFKYRANLLSDQDRKWLGNGQGEKVSKRALAQIMSPFGLSDGKLIKEDPYLLLPAYLASRPKLKKNFKIKDGWDLIGDHIVLVFKLRGQAFNQNFQDEFVSAYESLKTPNGVEILKTGAVFYGQRGIEQAQSEATLIGAISLSGIILLNIIFLRSIRPILLSLLAISSGIIGGLGVCLLLFGKLHLMAFIFGAGLIGIAVDYTFHYCCDGLGEEKSNSVLRTQNIARPLTFGVISSSLGFLILATAPFPGLQQIAIFATAGLIMAYLTVMCIYPLIDKSTGVMHFKRLWGFDRNWSLIIAGVSILGALAGATLFHIDDDVRRLQSLPLDLKAEEDQIRNITGLDNATRILLVHGKNEQDVLQLEENLLPKLSNIQGKGDIIGFQAMAQLIPSIKKQKENRDLVQNTLLGEKLDKHLSHIGMTRKNNIYGEALYLDPEGFLPEFRLAPSVHLIRLSGVTNTEALIDLASNHENVRLVDQVKNISETLGKYRERAILLIGFSCLIIWAFLVKNYGFKNASIILSVPISAVVLTPFIASIFGESFTFFNAMALLLVLAIGLDYALFSHEASSEKYSGVMIANGLSAASTIMAFGLLALSDMYAIHAFGMTILIGISIAYALAPLTHIKKQEDKSYE
ncbi:putative RND superfamily drug exporter [Candidatus Terasakiella magnetica]|uniref:Putative RND superfamily drug exporter n=2 Tax=Candidatus Terasakiella magnetica TaxID=1867952 RepID=A0A1C3RH98_9PROT|nr:putative RND superfamily drug exporter [Candidatus Terasakiella magnetica]